MIGDVSDRIENITRLGPPAARPRIGQMLVARGLVNRTQIAEAVAQQRETGERLGEVLLRFGAVPPLDLYRVLADHFGVPFVDLNEIEIDPVAAQTLPQPFARARRVLPLLRDNGRLIVASSEANDVFTVDDTAMIAGEPIVMVLVEPTQLAAAMARLLRRDDFDDPMGAALVDAEAEREPQPTPEELASLDTEADAPIVRYVNALVAEAVDRRASDIHLEPVSDGLRVRLRIDGVLHDASRAPVALRNGIISRIKVVSGIDIAQRRLPQDGRMSWTFDEQRVDVRVTTLPTAPGEAVILRLLDRGRGPIELGQLGLLPDAFERYAVECEKRHGTILLTGPTGSGKSTTLHATVGAIDDPSLSVVTVEDPIEYRRESLKQIQINRAAGLTFPVALRSILRADPDVILVGEIRDDETAKIASEAALTGHLVLASIHTNDAASTPMRLVEMGLEPYLVASAITCVVGQRLVRRLCDRCKEPYRPDHSELRKLGWPEPTAGEPPAELFRSVGCSDCHHTGYRGRTGLFEVMVVSEAIERLIASNAPSRKLRNQAIEEGMMPLRECGLRKVAAGEISIDELLRVAAA